MNKKVLIISTSPRKNGNSETLADAFLKGAADGGNIVEKISLYDKTIGFCKGCLACQKTGRCVIHDDADTIAQKMLSADVLVFATPKMRKIVKKIILMALVFIFVFTAAPANHVEAAKKPQLKTTKVTLKVGQKKQLKVANTKNKIKWSSSKKSVAGVSKKGKVTAKKAGKATIYAKVGKRTLKCRVTVVKKEKVILQVGNSSFTITLENNSAANALADMLREKPLVIQMSDYSGFEKVGSLGKRLPTSNSQTTTSAGDIVLYNGNQIVIFYGSNTWSYTRLGKIDDLSGLEEALGSGDVTVIFSMK